MGPIHTDGTISAVHAVGSVGSHDDFSGCRAARQV